jgi:prepilin signal peptidase PulO-like enzyme (type II secretory pathway)
LELSLTEILQIIYAVLIGLSFGTFFNVVAERLPQGMSIVFPPPTAPPANTPSR